MANNNFKQNPFMEKPNENIMEWFQRYAQFTNQHNDRCYWGFRNMLQGVATIWFIGLDDNIDTYETL